MESLKVAEVASESPLPELTLCIHCGSAKSVLDLHPYGCVRCKGCSFENACSQCVFWPEQTWDDIFRSFNIVIPVGSPLRSCAGLAAYPVDGTTAATGASLVTPTASVFGQYRRSDVTGRQGPPLVSLVDAVYTRPVSVQVRAEPTLGVAAGHLAAQRSGQTPRPTLPSSSRPVEAESALPVTERYLGRGPEVQGTAYPVPESRPARRDSFEGGTRDRSRSPVQRSTCLYMPEVHGERKSVIMRTDECVRQGVGYGHVSFVGARERDSVRQRGRVSVCEPPSVYSTAGRDVFACRESQSSWRASQSVCQPAYESEREPFVPSLSRDCYDPPHSFGRMPQVYDYERTPALHESAPAFQYESAPAFQYERGTASVNEDVENEWDINGESEVSQQTVRENVRVSVKRFSLQATAEAAQICDRVLDTSQYEVLESNRRSLAPNVFKATHGDEQQLKELISNRIGLVAQEINSFPRSGHRLSVPRESPFIHSLKDFSPHPRFPWWTESASPPRGYTYQDMVLPFRDFQHWASILDRSLNALSFVELTTNAAARLSADTEDPTVKDIHSLMLAANVATDQVLTANMLLSSHLSLLRRSAVLSASGVTAPVLMAAPFGSKQLFGPKFEQIVTENKLPGAPGVQSRPFQSRGRGRSSASASRGSSRGYNQSSSGQSSRGRPSFGRYSAGRGSGQGSFRGSSGRGRGKGKSFGRGGYSKFQ